MGNCPGNSAPKALISPNRPAHYFPDRAARQGIPTCPHARTRWIRPPSGRFRASPMRRIQAPLAPICRHCMNRRFRLTSKGGCLWPRTSPSGATGNRTPESRASTNYSPESTRGWRHRHTKAPPPYAREDSVPPAPDVAPTRPTSRMPRPSAYRRPSGRRIPRSRAHHAFCPSSPEPDQWPGAAAGEHRSGR